MQPRDLFDGILLVVLGISVYLDTYGLSVSTALFGEVVGAVVSLDLAIYLVIAGVLGVVFVGYIAVYLPWKQSKNTPR